MDIQFEANENQDVAIMPYFGGLFWVHAADLEAAISEGMNMFRCFQSGDGQFRKGKEI